MSPHSTTCCRLQQFPSANSRWSAGGNPEGANHLPGSRTRLLLPDGWPERKSQIPDEDFLVDDGDTVEQWVARHQDAAETSRQVAAAMELDQSCARTDIIDYNLREVLLHLIEETARHAGHSDIIRETVEGSRGM